MLIYKSDDFIPLGNSFTSFPSAELRSERRHSHDFYEIGYVNNGEGLHYNGKEFQTVKNGSFVLISPEKEHCFVSPESNNIPWVMVYDCLFTKDFFEDVMNSFINIEALKSSALYNLFENKKTFCIVLSDNSSSEIKFYMDAIKRKCDLQFGNTDILVKNLLLNMLIEISNIYDAHLALAKNTSNPTLGIEHLIRYINVNIDIDLNLNLLADQIHMSPSYLSRYFKQKTGKTISEYIMELRIKRAQDLLLSTTHSITDVCFLCGYSSIANFRKYFKKYVGLSPREFKKINGK